MNSPDYNDFIDMFSVPTTISPLPPTPLASLVKPLKMSFMIRYLPFGHNLPFRITLKDFMEQSTVSESP
ncbi:hypothetical protein TNCV_4042441 [Trichonephila clavipes]|nr:hypothetical protein TNCV_4042441 [Trichonephila clavipes]